MCAVFITYRRSRQLLGPDVVQAGHIHTEKVTAHDGFAGADESVDTAGPAKSVVNRAFPEAVVREVVRALK